MAAEAPDRSPALAPFAEEAAHLIPTPCPENHAAFLHRLPDGSLAAVWFAGDREGVPNVRIYLSRFDEESAVWAQAEAVSPSSPQSHQNPVLATLPSGEVWLLYTAQDLGAQDTAVIMRRRSADGGRTWTEPAPLIPDTGIFIRQDLVVLAEGTLLLPAFRCSPLPGRQWFGDADVSVVLRSTDGGENWQEVEVPHSAGAVHMDIVPFADGELVAFFRSRWADAVYRSTSRDAGATWSSPVPLDTPNNNSSLQMRHAPLLGPDTVLAVLNPLRADQGSERGDADRPHDAGKVTAPGTPQPLSRHAVWGVPRIPLVLLRSDDRGRRWTPIAVLEEEGEVPADVLARAKDRSGEMSYPTLVVADDGTVDIAYSYCRLAIKHRRFSPDVREGRR